MATIKTKRVYEAFEEPDGFRILVDRLWPRGIKKEDLKFNVWMKEIAPSTELRKWFHHENGDWQEFRKRYVAELTQYTEVEKLQAYVQEHKTVTLLYGAKDEEHNHAIVLKEFIEER